MKCFNFGKNCKSLICPRRGTKAYPFGKGVSIIMPTNKEREYLENSFDYDKDELKVFDFDKNCFNRLCYCKYDNVFSEHKENLLREIEYFISDVETSDLFYKLILSFENIKTYRDMAAFLLYQFRIHSNPEFKEEDEQSYDNILDEKQKLHVLIKMFGW